MLNAETIGRDAKWWLVAAAVAAAVAFALARRGDDRPLVLAGETMGTTYRVVLGDFEGGVEIPPGGDPEEVLRAAAEAVAADALAAVNAAFNTYDPASDLARFNAAPAGEPVPVAAETVQLVRRAFDLSAATGGAFDPTVGPLVRRWQFGPGRGRLEVPTEAETDALLARVGTALVEVGKGTLTKRADGVELDLSAMAKGHGVDRVSAALADAGFPASLTEIGGELAARGAKPDGSPWRVSVMNPRDPFSPAARGEPRPLRDAGMATSGDYFNFHEVDGRRYGHTLDPRTGRPVTHELAAVTVVAPDCATADALATALMVMGPTEGYDWAEAHDVAAVFTAADGAVRQTPCHAAWKDAGELSCRPSLSPPASRPSSSAG